MPSLPLYQVDAFTDRPFSGNPAAVCPLPAPIDAGLMQDIAAENNLSETAFFHPHPSGQGFALRWFTPTVEVDLCGHATLASAFVLMNQLDRTRSSVVFHTRSGALPVTKQGDLFILDLPARSLTAVDDAIAWADVTAALGARPLELLGRHTWLAVFATADEVRRLSPDMAAASRLGTTMCVTAPADDGLAGIDFVSRYFAPGHGVPEDPVTGSAHCLLAPYWAARLGKPRLRAKQVSRRGGDLECEMAGDRVLIGGKARLILTGTLQY
jgi:PhzF family phenazine biosynthesis protein